MYNFEKLSSDIEIAVSADHTFGTDAVILADFAKIKPRDNAVDMGTGCGIIPFLWLRDEKINSVSCLDIQKNAYEQVIYSIKHNNLGDRMKAYNCDLRKISDYFSAESFSLVTMNPPYKPVGTGIKSLSESAKIARHEICCNIDDACRAASYLLKYSGRFCLCHRPERLVGVIDAMKKYKLEPKKLRFVQDKENEPPFLFLIQGQKGANPFLRVEANLIIKNSDGKFTDEMLSIYGSYAEGYSR